MENILFFHCHYYYYFYHNIVLFQLHQHNPPSGADFNHFED